MEKKVLEHQNKGRRTVEAKRKRIPLIKECIEKLWFQKMVDVLDNQDNYK